MNYSINDNQFDILYDPIYWKMYADKHETIRHTYAVIAYKIKIYIKNHKNIYLGHKYKKLKRVICLAKSHSKLSEAYMAFSKVLEAKLKLQTKIYNYRQILRLLSDKLYDNNNNDYIEELISETFSEQISIFNTTEEHIRKIIETENYTECLEIDISKHILSQCL